MNTPSPNVVPQVTLVGAGPGNAGLLTLRAVECLRQADLVIYDRLTAPEMLRHAPHAEHLCVNELHDTHRERSPLVIQRMIDSARQGKCVVRLKGGDPFLFGRGGEEGEALLEAGIDFEIVPGITAALGSAFAGIPLTHRDHSSAVALLAGHEQDDKDFALDWEGIAKFPGTLVIYMGLARLEENVGHLLRHGKSPNTPAAAIEWVTTGRQRAIEAPLEHLPTRVTEAGLRSPTLVIVGDVVALRSKLNWFERLPLLGKRIVVTRPRHQAAQFLRELELLGASVTLLPTVEVEDPPDWKPVDDALDRLASFAWLVFTSTNGVHFFIRRLRERGLDLRALGNLRFAVIGPATGDALRSYHLEPDLMPEQYRSEQLVEALRERVRDQRVLLARADRGREILREQLSEVADVEQIAVYSQVDGLADDGVLKHLERIGVDAITITSANLGRSLKRMAPDWLQRSIEAGRTKLISISPVTSEALQELGWPIGAEATVYTMEGVREAILDLARQGW